MKCMSRQQPIGAPPLRGVPCETQAASRDVEAETAALSLARRRGKSAPSVDTKLADAWLGFYVALTKSSARSAEAATQASTEVATEASFSEDTDCEPDSGLPVSEPPSGKAFSESWADLSEDLSPKKRTSRRSHRRRRTRGRGGKGKKGSGEAVGDGLDEEFEAIDEEEDGVPPAIEASVCASPMSRAHMTPCGVTSTSAPSPTKVVSNDASTRWPFQSPMAKDAVQAVMSGEPLPFLSPSKACTGPQGMLMGTSPSAALTPVHCEASARTPPKIPMGLPMGCSPVACMMPSTPTAFGTLTHQGGHAAYQGSHMMLAASPMHGAASPAMGIGFGMASPCHPQEAPAPTFFPTIAGQYQGSALVPSPEFQAATAIATPQAHWMRSWLAGGLPSSDEDLALRLKAAAPEAYED